MRLSILIAYLGALLSTAVHAQVEGSDVGAASPVTPDPFIFLDLDGDGMLSVSEFTEGRLLRFERLDENQDGLVTSEELSQMNSERSGKQDGSRMIGRMDQDGSGTLTQDEFQSFGTTMFARRDQNEDGYLSAEEQNSFRNRSSRTRFDGQSPQ